MIRPDGIGYEMQEKGKRQDCELITGVEQAGC